MHPKEAINAALKEAMKNKDNARRDALRLIQSAIKQVEIDTRADLDEAAVWSILQKEAKSRRETIEERTQAGRDAEQEVLELAVIEEFLPKQLSREEIEALAKQAIGQVGATSAKDLGKVMGALQPHTKNRADGKLVNDVVRSLLG